MRRMNNAISICCLMLSFAGFNQQNVQDFDLTGNVRSVMNLHFAIDSFPVYVNSEATLTQPLDNYYCIFNERKQCLRWEPIGVDSAERYIEYHYDSSGNFVQSYYLINVA